MTDAEKAGDAGGGWFRPPYFGTHRGPAADTVLKLHGTLRDVRAAEEYFNPHRPVSSVMVQGVELKAGDRSGFAPRTALTPLT